MLALLSPMLLLGASLSYVVYKVVYRLFFHPLSNIPGPWYAAISTAYEFWWDCAKCGKYMFKISEMHEKYGPIIRINPWEVHINDPNFINTLWTNNKLNKDPFFYAFGYPSSTVFTVSAEQHRIRRGAMAQFFSKANVVKFEPRIIARVQQLCERIEEHHALDKPITVSDAYRCLATDVVTDIAVPKTRDFLAHPDFMRSMGVNMKNAALPIVCNRHVPIILPILMSIPRSVIAYLDRDGSLVDTVDLMLDLHDQARAVVEKRETKATPTVLNAVFEDPSLPPSEKTLDRIFDEVFTVVGAGTETTGTVLSHLTYHVIANPTVYQTLKAELNGAASKHGIGGDEFLSVRIVESLPYLRSIMNETLRISTPVTGRLPRRNSKEATTYTTSSGKVYVLPPNTAISMSIRDIHFDSSIFAEPDTFNPLRWTEGSAEQIARLERYLVPFGKGIRQCIGIELAKQEILLVAANLFRRFELELWETTERDMQVCHDLFSPFGPADSNGVRVKVKAG